LRQDVVDFLSGFSKSVVQGLGDVYKKSGIDKSIEENVEKNIEKLRKKLFITGVAISIVATGFFLILWGIASAIDKTFVMKGLGFVLIGLIGVLAGVVVYKK
jgi:hypothetical protein